MEGIGAGVEVKLKTFRKTQIPTQENEFCGGSMGGYGAILYGSLLDVDYIILADSTDRFKVC